MFSEEQTPKAGIVLEAQYLPGLAYFTALLPHPVVYLEAQERFQKQTWRNRCQILTAQGLDTLVVPVLGGRSGVPIQAARPDYGQPWVARHWRAIRSAYGKAPFFEHYGPVFEAVYQRKPAFLFEMNLELLSICLNLLGWKKSLVLTTEYQVPVPEYLTDARSLIHPKRLVAEQSFYQPVAYRHVFGSEFFPNLSILDLLFNQGPQATALLRQSARL